MACTPSHLKEVNNGGLAFFYYLLLLLIISLCFAISLFNTTRTASASTSAVASDRAFISSMAGDFDSGSTITLTGYNFGTKSPAKPMVWADFDSGSANTSPFGMLTNPWRNNHAADYTTLGQDVNSTGSLRHIITDSVSLILLINLEDSHPHYPGVTKVYVFNKRKYDTSDYWTYQNHLTGTSTGGNTSTTLNDTTANWEANAYRNKALTITGGTGAGQTRKTSASTATSVTIATPWDVVPDSTSTYDLTGFVNYKFFRLWAKPTGSSSNRPNTVFVYSGEATPSVAMTTEYSGSGCKSSSPQNSKGYGWPPPAQRWTTEEYYATMAYQTGEAHMWRDGDLQMSRTNFTTWQPDCDTSPYDPAEWHAISVENFLTINAPNPRYPAYVYMDDVYIDNTPARIVLGNADTLAASTHREIQIPQTWSDTSLTFIANPGTFADGATAYLYVVDASGNSSRNGFRITMGESRTPSTVISATSEKQGVEGVEGTGDKSSSAPVVSTVVPTTTATPNPTSAPSSDVSEIQKNSLPQSIPETFSSILHGITNSIYSAFARFLRALQHLW